MKVFITIVTIAALATLTKSASNDFQQRTSHLISTFTSALDQSSANGPANKLIQQYLKLVKTASLAGDSDVANNALARAERIVPQLNSLINNNLSTRNNVVSAVADLVAQRSELLGSLLHKLSDNLDQSGNSPLAAILKTAAEAIRERFLSNENVRNTVNNAADALDMIEDAVTLLNTLTGGVNGNLNMVASAIEALDSASDTLLGREKDNDDKNMIVSKVIGLLYKLKNAKNQAAFDAVNKVCAKLDAAQSKSS